MSFAGGVYLVLTHLGPLFSGLHLHTRNSVYFCNFPSLRNLFLFAALHLRSILTTVHNTYPLPSHIMEVRPRSKRLSDKEHQVNRVQDYFEKGGGIFIQYKLDGDDWEDDTHLIFAKVDRAMSTLSALPYA